MIRPTCLYDSCTKKSSHLTLADRPDLKGHCREHQSTISGLWCEFENCGGPRYTPGSDYCLTHHNQVLKGEVLKPRGAKPWQASFEHGTSGGYSNYKCRCEKCTDAWNTYCAQSKVTRRKSFVADESTEHGLERTYQAGCACSECKSAHTVYSREIYTIRKQREAMPVQTACDCCGLEYSKRLVTDHEHGTTNIRGLLCHSCNTGIGKLGDNLEGLLKAVDYLQRYEIP